MMGAGAPYLGSQSPRTTILLVSTITNFSSLPKQNSGPNTNGCQFFILTAPAPHLNGKHVVFGKVVEGLDVVRKVENVRTRDERPAQEVAIAQCGEM